MLRSTIKLLNQVKRFSTSPPRNTKQYKLYGALPLMFGLVGGGILANNQGFKSKESIKSDSLVKIPVSELVKHKVLDDLWVTIDGKVYDLTNFIKTHPGGVNTIYQFAGKDASEVFSKQHSKGLLEILPEEACLGQLEGVLEKEELSPEEVLMEENKLKKPPVNHMFNVNDFEYIAKRVIPKDLYMFFATGADDEATLRECQAAYSRVFFRPRILTDTNDIDLSTVMLGNKVSLPLYITAFAGQAYLAPEAERTLAKLANKLGIMYMAPRLASIPLLEILKLFDSDTPVWCQCCVNPYDPELEHAFEEIEKHDQIKGVFVTTDAATGGNREKDFKTRLEGNNSSELSRYSSQVKPYPAMTWKQVIKIKESTSKPIILKGVQRSEDVLKAAELGLDGVVISNHGGRQMDYSQPPLEVLAETMPLLRQQPYYNKDKFNVFIDGGVRRASDIIKAVCLGASGVGMGKAFAYALASYGEEGAAKLLELMQIELNRDMKLIGANNIGILNESFVNLRGLYNRSGNYMDSYLRNYEPLPVPKI